MASLFTKIIAGEIPCKKVWEDDQHLAFLDIRPVQPGHTLVIPKREVSYLFDLEEHEYAALWSAARTVEAKLSRQLGCERVVVTVIGWEVPHVHVHLIPTNSIRDVGMPPAATLSTEEEAQIQALLCI
ncbi:MAG: HIT family protein [bacterium]|jgi:histidine triad (HIT) family protein|nr:HIT family protein [Planctomycetota bacterium]HIL52700.1 HIT family protein [Planctomycetota bacterium]